MYEMAHHNIHHAKSELSPALQDQCSKLEQ